MTHALLLGNVLQILMRPPRRGDTQNALANKQNAITLYQLVYLIFA